MSPRRWGYRWEPSFFGLGIKSRESFLEHAFILQYHLGMSYADCKSLPLQYRHWFIERVIKEIDSQRSSSINEPMDHDAKDPMGAIASRARRFK